MRLILSSLPNKSVAARIGRRIVKARLAVCVSTTPVRSTYWWKGHVESATEVLALFKTTEKMVLPLMRELKRLHPYEVPEILVLKVERAARPYLAWLDSSLVTPKGSRRGRAARGPR
jgi:periplasmic divalent cation tolerance protein